MRKTLDHMQIYGYIQGTYDNDSNRQRVHSVGVKVEHMYVRGDDVAKQYNGVTYNAGQE